MAAAADIWLGSVIVNSASCLILRVYVHANFIKLVIPGVFDALGLPSFRRFGQLCFLLELAVLLTEMGVDDNDEVDVEGAEIAANARPS